MGTGVERFNQIVEHDIIKYEFSDVFSFCICDLVSDIFSKHRFLLPQNSGVSSYALAQLVEPSFGLSSCLVTRAGFSYRNIQPRSMACSSVQITLSPRAMGRFPRDSKVLRYTSTVRFRSLKEDLRSLQSRAKLEQGSKYSRYRCSRPLRAAAKRNSTSIASAKGCVRASVPIFLVLIVLEFKITAVGVPINLIFFFI